MGGIEREPHPGEKQRFPKRIVFTHLTDEEYETSIHDLKVAIVRSMEKVDKEVRIADPKIMMLTSDY